MPQGWTAGPAPADAWTPGPAPAAADLHPDLGADFRAGSEPPSRSLWALANTPLVPQIADAAHAIAAHIDAPALDRSETVAQIRGFLSGATEGAGDLVAGYTSPIGLALLLSGLGSEGTIAKAIPGLKGLLKLPAVQIAQRAVQATAGAGFAGHGAAQVVTDPTLAGKARGVVEMAGGGLGMASALPRARVPNLTTGVAADAEAVAAGQGAGVPVDLATASGNKVIRGAQFLADRTVGGSLVAAPAEQRAAAALERWGGRLADEAHPTATTPEQAGQGVRDALTARVEAGRAGLPPSPAVTPEQAGHGIRGGLETKIAGHERTATTHYDEVDAHAAKPENTFTVEIGGAAVDTMPSWQAGELRRMVHELDAAPYQPRTWEDRTSEPGKKGNAGGGDYEIHAGSGGAQVFHDITQRSGSTATRGVLQSQLEAFLAGGPETPNVRAAVEVAKDRVLEKWGKVSKPELPPSAMSEPTRLEGGRVTSEPMGLPVDLRPVKAPLQKVLAELLELMPVAQEAQSAGIKAIRNILDAPDFMPLVRADKNLGAIKAIARERGGVSKIAVRELEQAVQAAAANGGPEVMRALRAGRDATIAKYATEAVRDALPGGKFSEPTAVVKAATAPHDGGIELLRTLDGHVPQATAQIGHALIAELRGLEPAAALTRWRTVGPETRALLFKGSGQVAALEAQFVEQASRAGAVSALPGGKFEEPTAIVKAATAPKDAGIEHLRQIRDTAPDTVPPIARAKLEELLGLLPDKAWAEWGKLGAQTRGILFPTPGHAQAIEHLFLLQKRMATNPNPSGTAYVAAIGVQGAAFWTNPITAIATQVGGAVISAALHSPAVTRALTRVQVVGLNPAASGAMRAAALASLSRATRDAGLPALVPSRASTDEPSSK